MDTPEHLESTGQMKIKLPRDLSTHKGIPTPSSDDVQLPRSFNERTQNLPSGLKKAKSINLQEYLDQSLNDLKEQLRKFQDVCSRISSGEWQLTDVVDYLHILVKSLNFDAVSILVIDPANPNEFLPMVSRGYSTPPTKLTRFWKTCLTGHGSVNWQQLLDMAQLESGPLAHWIEKENVFRVGYSPVHDGQQITGFLIIVSYEERKLSPLSSVLLELSGGHIGLALAAQRAKSTKTHGHEDGQETRLSLLSLKDILEKISTGNISPAELNDSIEQGQILLNQALSKLPQ